MNEVDRAIDRIQHPKEIVGPARTASTFLAEESDLGRTFRQIRPDLLLNGEDIKKRPDFVRAYVEATLEGLRYARDNQEESLKILLKHKPELEPALTKLQLKNALTEVFLPPESAPVRLGYMKPEIMEKTVKVVNDYFDVARKIASKEVYSNQFIRR